MKNVNGVLETKRIQVNNTLQEILPPAGTRPALIHEAMRYSVMAGGKRIRPILTLAAAETLGSPDNADALRAGCAVELLHTYTLIHDDLPCMDNDALRRGLPTCHIKFGEANALLAGDALLTLAFEMLGETGNARLVTELARAAGSQGVIGGQIEDLAAETSAPDSETLEYIHLHKTADLIAVSLRMGAICAGGAEAEIAALSDYGTALGLAFQIIDDILDETADEEKLGKPVGSDREQGKLTWVSLHGLDAARAKAAELTEAAGAALAQLDGRDTALLRGITALLLSRDH